MLSRLSGALALLVPTCLLAACGNSTVAAPLPSSVGQFAPPFTTAQAQRPFSFDYYAPGWTGGGSCSTDQSSDTLEADPFTVGKPVQVTAFTPTEATGVIAGSPMYSAVPATVDGHRNVFDGGTWNSLTPTNKNDHLAAMNWDARQPLVGATLQPGTRYMIFLPLQDPTAGGSVDRFTIDWTSPSGTSGTSVWRMPFRWSPSC